jgi:hypothetical protein
LAGVGGRAGDWVAEAGRLLANLGFTLYHASPDLPRGGADLLVALREVPALTHFDPELVEYWVAREGRGRPARLERSSRLPLTVEFEWGAIRIIDRLGVENQFLSFGGELRAQELERATAVVRFRSPAPIFRWAGHSQGVDPLTDEVGAFFGRLMVPVDFEPGAESRIAEAPPLVLYAACVADVRERFGHRRGGLAQEPEPARWARAEAARLERDAPEAWRAAPALRHALGLAG